MLNIKILSESNDSCFIEFIWCFANIFLGAKHSGSKSLILTNKLSAGMLRPRLIVILASFGHW